MWAPRLGGVLCGAHHLEHSLRESDGPLLLLDLPGAIDASQAVQGTFSVASSMWCGRRKRGTRGLCLPSAPI